MTVLQQLVRRHVDLYPVATYANAAKHFQGAGTIK